ncbi:unnamed protein product [Allacma fusca]|uniref:Uncharacterized protein n=1 Tax=Allacma fusca TaxID=39272 RepID=A0A8J2LE41_9HEXA|nr:unnamed protein product [Allacma fusca]
MDYLRILSLVFALTSLGSCHSTSGSTNLQSNQNTQLTNGEPNQKSTEQNAANQFFYRNSNPSPSYIPNYQVSNGQPYRQEPSSGPSPFLGLSSNGEFQLSAYFSQIFWGVVAVVVSVAVIIWLIRLFFPHESLGNLVDKIKSTKAGKNLDIDRITSLVYGALDSYDNWSKRDTRGSIETRPEIKGKKKRKSLLKTALLFWANIFLLNFEGKSFNLIDTVYDYGERLNCES